MTNGVGCDMIGCSGSLSELVGGLWSCDRCGVRHKVSKDTARSSGIPVCAVCETFQRLDFHHWDYDRDIGIHICRECHTDIHDGKRARDQTKDAVGGGDWRTRAGMNLIELHEDEHGRPDSWRNFTNRYNIPTDIEPYSHILNFKL